MLPPRAVELLVEVENLKSRIRPVHRLPRFPRQFTIRLQPVSEGARYLKPRNFEVRVGFYWCCKKEQDSKAETALVKILLRFW
jgi:hypothetical protein